MASETHHKCAGKHILAFVVIDALSDSQALFMGASFSGAFFVSAWLLVSLAMNGTHSDIEADADSRFRAATAFHLMSEPAWEQQQQAGLRLAQDPATGVSSCRIPQRWQQHLSTGTRIEKGNGATPFRGRQVNHTAEQAVGMQVGPDRISLAVHNGPGVVEAGCGFVGVPPEVVHRLLGAAGDPQEQRVQARIRQQIGPAVPAALIGERQSRFVVALERKNSLTPTALLIVLLVLEAPERGW